VHLCFGYGHYVKVDKPNTYSFLAPLNACAAHQISIEAAQPNLDPRTLDMLPDKVVMYGVLDLKDQRVETPEIVAQRIRGALRHVTPQRLVIAPDCGMKYLPRDVAFGKMKAMVEGAKMLRAEYGG
jgi:5-methyltetrahydropteroyltriglutamate--homocysteine methyltransferase